MEVYTYDELFNAMAQFIPENRRECAKVTFWIKLLNESLYSECKISEDVKDMFEEHFPKSLEDDVITSNEVQSVLRDGYNTALVVDSLDDVDFIFDDYVKFIEHIGLYVTEKYDPRPVIDCTSVRKA